MEYIALGCMSGTSLDGIDCSLIKSDGVSYVNEISNQYIPYSDELQLKLHNVILKGYFSSSLISKPSPAPRTSIFFSFCSFIMIGI